MKKILTIAAALLAASMPATAGATAGTVTTWEYVNVEDGWSRSRTHDWFDTEGYLMWKNDGETERRYNANVSGAQVYVYYRKGGDDIWRVYDKYWCDSQGCVHN